MSRTVGISEMLELREMCKMLRSCVFAAQRAILARAINARSNTNSRVSLARWRRRVNDMNAAALEIELGRLLRSCSATMIARMHRSCFRGCRAAILIAGEVIMRRQLDHLQVIQPLINSYKEEKARDALMEESEDEEEFPRLEIPTTEEVDAIIEGIGVNREIDDEDDAATSSDGDDEENEARGDAVAARAAVEAAEAEEMARAAEAAETAEAAAMTDGLVRFFTNNGNDLTTARIKAENLTRLYRRSSDVPGDTAFFENSEGQLQPTNYDIRDAGATGINELLRTLEADNGSVGQLRPWMQSIFMAPRARERRWFDDMLERFPREFILPNANDFLDLLSRVYESFKGTPES